MTEQGVVMAQSFDDLFNRATGDLGQRPYAYQRRIAVEGFPDLIRVPTGSGKTLAAFLPWLYRSVAHPDQAVRATTPRRLVLVLPTRALTDQTERRVRECLANLGLSESIGVHAMMGGRLDRAALNEWRLGLHQRTVIICTLDMLVSRALLRGYGVPRASYSLDFALVTNGAQIVVDEIQLVPQGTATLRQISAFQQRYGTAEPFGLTVMSATVDEQILNTVDRPFDAASARVVSLVQEDRDGPLRQRLMATRTVRRLPDVATPRAFAAAVVERHVSGSLTLVVVNTVDRAVELYRELAKVAGDVDLLLIHSRFRGVERSQHMARLEALANPSGPGGIVVTTQAIEAGVDIDAQTLVTEAAPWSSIVQRAGRCNRAGRFAVDQAVLWWARPLKPEPYATEDVDATADLLDRLEASALSSEDLGREGAELPRPDLRLRFLRRRDFDQLFDTTPDLSGSDIDIQPYIRAELDLDIQLAWVPDGWVEVEDGRGRAKRPPEAFRCPVSPSKVRDFLKKGDGFAWVLVPSADAWLPAAAQKLKPQDLVLVSAGSGGYDAVLGFQPNSRHPVDVSELAAAMALSKDAPEGGTASEEPGSISSQGAWLALSEHLTDVREQARSLVSVLDPTGIDGELRRVVMAAAYLHDVGKAHPDWQRALLAANPGHEPTAPGTWAKSPGNRPLRVVRDEPGRGVRKREGFRHELVSVFMLATPSATEILDRLDVAPRWRPLVRYLVAAHHGFLRVTARDNRWDGRDGRSIFGCFDGEETPALRLAEGELALSQVDLSMFATGRNDAWTDQALALIEELGPFRLAYLETLVRMADWRASASLELPGGMP